MAKCFAPVAAWSVQGVSEGVEPLEESAVAASADDVLEPAGSVLSVLDDVIVVQGQANSRPISEGCVAQEEGKALQGHCLSAPDPSRSTHELPSAVLLRVAG